jgi:regulator of sigma E protease
MTEFLPQPGLGFTLLTYIAMIAILVVVHEGGHYLAGRLFNVKTDVFAVGFGREVLGWNDRRGTRWRLNWLPLGGYVKFTGDMNETSQPSAETLALPAHERAGLFAFKPLWQRTIIVLAGPMINFVFAIAILAGFYMAFGHPLTPPVVSSVSPGGAAAAAGIKAGDRVVAIDGAPVERFEDIVSIVMGSTGEPMTLVVETGGAQRTLTLVPTMVETKDAFGNVTRHPRLGIARGDRVVVPVGPGAAIAHGFSDTGAIVGSIANTLRQVVTGARSLDDLGGPIKTGQVTGQQASLGILSFIAFMAFFSINLGFINLLPIPTLDGGHLLLYAIEAIRRRPMEPKVQEWAFMSGFAALMTLMVVLTWNDLGSIGVWNRLTGWLS